jgi:DNA-directed RNA polymerase I, II, and III subunit RPABC5
MIIPIRCFSCNNVIADKYVYYMKELARLRPTEKETDNRFYMDGTQIPQTCENEILKRLGLKRPCCRCQFLTHVPLLEKI